MYHKDGETIVITETHTEKQRYFSFQHERWQSHLPSGKEEKPLDFILYIFRVRL